MKRRASTYVNGRPEFPKCDLCGRTCADLERHHRVACTETWKGRCPKCPLFTPWSPTEEGLEKLMAMHARTHAA